ncbi:MAG: RNA polymerase sigma factor [Proteobacteria bacterium]|nr:RNA polymerase sigma factor [Pseudomonadota bacterium]
MTDDFSKELISLLPNLRRFAFSLCRSWDLGDDLVQQACEKALKNRDSYEPGTRMDSWLFRIIRNSWIDRHRRTATEGTTVEITDAQDRIGFDGAGQMESRLMLDAAMKAMNELSDEYREVLLLACVEELSYKEVAEVLEIPMGTVMSRLARARKKLVEIMGINPGMDRSQGK